MIEKIKSNWLLIILVLYCLVPIVWYIGKGDVLINGLDTNFPLDPVVWFMRRLFVWNDVSSAGINFASSTAGIFFHLVQVIPFLLGVNLQFTQIISLMFWFSSLVFSAFYFSKKIFENNKVSQIVFVTIYVFNVYLFNSWENIKVANLAVVVTLPLFLGIFISYIKSEIKIHQFIFYTAIIGLVSSGSGINPAYFIVILGGIIIFGLVQNKLKILSLMVGVIYIVNLFWIVPTANHVLFSHNNASSLSDIGFTNWLDSLSEHTSLLNVIRLQGAWDWYALDDSGTPLYIPYANNYFKRFPFIAFSILLPALAIFGFLVKEEKLKKNKIYFGTMLLLGLFLASGTHAPTGVIYEFLTKKLPFFSFFRSPWYIFTPYLTLSIAALISYLFVIKKNIIKYFALILIIGNLIYVYPLITGKIYRPQKSDSFFVNFPSYVFEAGNWLNNDSNKGRVLSYPGDEIENFSWGYRGIESILNLLSTRETIFSGLNDSGSLSSRVIDSLYLALQRNQIQIAESIVAKLNISTIFVKNDQRSLWNVSPESLENYNSEVFGEWKFHQIPENKYLSKIYFPTRIFYGLPAEKIEKMNGVVLSRDLIVNLNDTIVAQIPDKNRVIGEITIAKNSQLEDFEAYQKNSQRQSLSFISRDPQQVDYIIEIINDGFYQPILENFRSENFGIDLSKGLTVLLDGVEYRWKVKENGDLTSFEDIKLSSGTHKVTVKLNNRNLLGNQSNVLGLSNREDKEKFLSFKIEPFTSAYPYLIEFDYRNIYGRRSIFIVEQKNDNTDFKFQTEGPPFSPEKIRYSFYFNPVYVTNSYLDVKPLILPTNKDDSLGTKIEFSNLAAYPIFTNNMYFLKVPEKELNTPTEITFQKTNPVKYKGQVLGSQGSHAIVFSENFSSDWNLKLFNLDGRPINYTPLHFSANLYANGWFIEDLIGDYKFEIYYKPQVVYNFSLMISIGAYVLIVGYYLWRKYKV